MKPPKMEWAVSALHRRTDRSVVKILVLSFFATEGEALAECTKQIRQWANAPRSQALLLKTEGTATVDFVVMTFDEAMKCKT